MPILTEIGTKFKLQGVNTMQKKDLVTNIISRIEEVMRIKYQPKTKEEFKQIAKMVLDSILPQLSKTCQATPNQQQPQQPPTAYFQAPEQQIVQTQSSQFSSQMNSGASNNTAKSLLTPDSSPLDQLKLINLTNCICWGNPVGSNLLINCKNLLPHPPVNIYGSPVPNQPLPTSPYACPLLFHHGCHPYPKKDLDTFQCPRCQILTNDPLHQIFHIFYEPILMFQKTLTLTINLKFTHFTQISKNQDFAVEIRCLKLDGKNFFEQTWPDKMTLKVNGKLVKDVKALHHNSSLKKRRDEKYLARFGWKIGQNKVEISWENVYDGKNSKAGAEKLWNNKGIPYVVTILGVQMVGIPGIMQRVQAGGLAETQLENAVILEDNKLLPVHQHKSLVEYRAPEELNYVENYDDKWKRILCVSTGGLYGVGRRLTIEESKIFIRNRFREGSEGGELGISEIKVDLLCKITYTMIQHPARGVNCTHLDCFNLNFFLQTMESNSVRKWVCPLCRKKCTQFVIDTYLEYILEVIEARDQVEEKVFFKSDASYTFEGVTFDSNSSHGENQNENENQQSETKRDPSLNQSLQVSAQRPGPVSKIDNQNLNASSFKVRQESNYLHSEKKPFKKKGNENPAEIDMLSIISSDEEPVNVKKTNQVNDQWVQENIRHETQCQQNSDKIALDQPRENLIQQIAIRNSPSGKSSRVKSTQNQIHNQSQEMASEILGENSTNQKLNNLQELLPENTVDNTDPNYDNNHEDNNNRPQSDQEDNQEEDTEDVNSQFNAPSHKSINQLLNRIQPLEAPSQLSRNHQHNHQKSVTSSHTEAHDIQNPLTQEQEQQDHRKIKTPTKNPQDKIRVNLKSKSANKQENIFKFNNNKKIDLSNTESKLTSLSPVLAKAKVSFYKDSEYNHTVVSKNREFENSSIHNTDFAPASEMDISNIMGELPRSENPPQYPQNLNEDSKAIKSNIGAEKLDTIEKNKKNLEKSKEHMSISKLDKKSKNDADSPLTSSKIQKKTKGLTKSNLTSVQKLDAKELTSTNALLNSGKSKKSKTSNHTPLKPIELENMGTPSSKFKMPNDHVKPELDNAVDQANQINKSQSKTTQDHELLSIKLTRQNSQIMLQEICSINEKSVSGQNSDSEDQNEQDLNEDVGSNAKSRYYAQKSDNIDQRKSVENTIGILSLEKSQNIEINLDEYSPITVGYSSRLKQAYMDTITEKEISNTFTMSKSKNKYSGFEDSVDYNTLDRSMEKTPNFKLLGKRQAPDALDSAQTRNLEHVDLTDEQINMMIAGDEDYQQDKQFLIDLQQYGSKSKRKNSDSECESQAQIEDTKGWSSWNEEFENYKRKDKELNQKIELLLMFVKNRKSQENSPETSETCKTYYKLLKSLKQHDTVYSDLNYFTEQNKKIKRGLRDDTELYKNLIGHYSFDNPEDSVLLNLKDNQSLSDVLKGTTMDSAIEIL